MTGSPIIIKGVSDEEASTSDTDSAAENETAPTPDAISSTTDAETQNEASNETSSNG